MSRRARVRPRAPGNGAAALSAGGSVMARASRRTGYAPDMRIAVGSLLTGTLFGATTSLVNALSSPYADLGTPLVGTVWASAAKVLSLLMDAGWSWAVLAVAMGWVGGRPARGALLGVLALTAATGAYSMTDAFLVEAGTDVLLWWLVGLPFGVILGAVGAAARRPGLVGLLAALTVPVGAAAQMVVLPPRPHITVTPATALAEAVVWTAAVLGAGWAIRRFWAERRAAAA